MGVEAGGPWVRGQPGLNMEKHWIFFNAFP